MKNNKELTPLQTVYKDTQKARTARAKRNKVRLGWTSTELAEDMLLVVDALAVDLRKFLTKGMAEPAKRVRRGTKALETLGMEFRVQSVKENKYGKN